MSLVPAFEIGFWNAWILMVYLPLHPLLMMLIDKAVGAGGMSKKMESAPYNKTEKRIFYVSMSTLFLLLIYSVFLPLKLGTIWYQAGYPVYLLGLIIFIITIVNIATTPLGEPFTRGMYRYSRHPMCLGMYIMHIGVSVASASWVFLLFSIVVMVLPDAKTEERCCLERYGDAYREYMNRTPRWIGIPK
ncbi:methyltransferase family protein [Chloroflexota bacterium]